MLDKIFTALSNSLFSRSKFEGLFRACALSLPVIFLTGNDVYKSDLTISDFGFVNKRSGYKSICRDPYSQSSSRPVVPDDYNLVRTIKITSKVNYKIFSKILI